MSTILDLDAIESRAQHATPGPYSVHHCDEPTCSLNDGRRITAPSHTPGVDIDLVATVYQGACDTEFFTHAREDVPALVARIRELVREQSEPPVVPAADCPPAEWTDASIVASSDDLTSDDDIAVAAYKTTMLGHELCVYAMPDGSWHWQVAHETWCADSRDEHPLPDADAAKAAAIGFARHRYESEQALRESVIAWGRKLSAEPYAESHLRQFIAVWMERRLMHAQMARLEALCEQLSQTIAETRIEQNPRAPEQSASDLNKGAPDLNDTTRGLYQKYSVRRTDGSSSEGGKHAACEYFVLDWSHDPFAIEAIRAYANVCEATYPNLAADLRARANIEESLRHGEFHAERNR